jgi:UPF0271 protein
VKVLLNIDAGEHDDEPEELYALADVVNIACGGHAGDERSMERVLRACQERGTLAGAHPSYEDREGFGRRELAVDTHALVEGIRRQCGALAEIAARLAVAIRFVKPHGALYHAANRDGAVADALRDGVRLGLGGGRLTCTLIGPPGGELLRLGRTSFGAFAREGFADRATRPDGSLVPRGQPGAVITDPHAARAQARAMIASGSCDTLCVHGDTAGAVAIARAVRSELDG